MGTEELPKETIQKINETNQTHLLEALNQCKSKEEKNNFIS